MKLAILLIGLLLISSTAHSAPEATEEEEMEEMLGDIVESLEGMEDNTSMFSMSTGVKCFLNKLLHIFYSNRSGWRRYQA